ncbi:hypothetical protein [Microbacterium allomyrinae]|uniref:Uncharacterized protein n=1 Tax=Microbacterium allomyrinae TaxID=2830666 RepID=A0A9X1LS32_9MICO|nr:hypothetical protein [Microbacterium allomyrinae]MCC2030638.1 hypothetical protein [Microbacterium allomyrinae]
MTPAKVVDGGWSTDEKGWKLDPSQAEHVRKVNAEAMARIDRTHTGYPVCGLCGQRVIKLDRFGLCSKVSQPHQDDRAAARADEKAANR